MEFFISLFQLNSCFIYEKGNEIKKVGDLRSYGYHNLEGQIHLAGENKETKKTIQMQKGLLGLVILYATLMVSIVDRYLERFS